MQYIAIKNVTSSSPNCGGAIPREGLVAHNTTIAEKLAQDIKERFPTVTIVNTIGALRTVVLDIPDNISVNEIENTFDCRIARDGPMDLIR